MASVVATIKAEFGSGVAEVDGASERPSSPTYVRIPCVTDVNRRNMCVLASAGATKFNVACCHCVRLLTYGPSVPSTRSGTGLLADVCRESS
jgi:hypothetical protein